MPVFIIDKLKPKNNGTFKLIDTLDINHKGYELEDFLDDLELKLNNVIDSIDTNARVVEMDVVNDWICWKYTTEDETQWKQLFDLSSISGSGGVTVTKSSEIYVGDTEPSDENLKMWVDTSSDESGDYVEIPTKVSELTNDMNFVSKDDIINNFSLTKSEDDKQIILKYGETTISTIDL